MVSAACTRRHLHSNAKTPAERNTPGQDQGQVDRHALHHGVCRKLLQPRLEGGWLQAVALLGAAAAPRQRAVEDGLRLQRVARASQAASLHSYKLPRLGHAAHRYRCHWVRPNCCCCAASLQLGVLLLQITP